MMKESRRGCSAFFSFAFVTISSRRITASCAAARALFPRRGAFEGCGLARRVHISDFFVFRGAALWGDAGVGVPVRTSDTVFGQLYCFQPQVVIRRPRAHPAPSQAHSKRFLLKATSHICHLPRSAEIFAQRILTLLVLALVFLRSLCCAPADRSAFITSVSRLSILSSVSRTLL